MHAHFEFWFSKLGLKTSIVSGKQHFHDVIPGTVGCDSPRILDFFFFFVYYSDSTVELVKRVFGSPMKGHLGRKQKWCCGTYRRQFLSRLSWNMLVLVSLVVVVVIVIVIVSVYVLARQSKFVSIFILLLLILPSTVFFE